MNESDFLARFHGVVRRGKNQWSARCPAHDDKNASLGITHKDGKWLLKCFAGCEASAVVSAAGLGMKDLFDTPLQKERPSAGARPSAPSGLTLEFYSEAKKISLELLKECGCANGARVLRHHAPPTPKVDIPYYDEGGNRVAMRERYAISGDGKFRWARGENRLCLYGLWRQPQDKAWMCLVEGESDAQTLWQAGFPALGLPGVGTVLNRPETLATLRQYSHIFIGIEADEGGMHLMDWLKEQEAEFQGRLRLYSIPLPVKDPSGLMCGCASLEEFSSKMRSVLDHAIPFSAFQEPKEIVELREKKASEKKGEEGEGTSGGRPQADYAACAKAYYGTLAGDGGLPSVRYYKGMWYEYWEHHYERMTDAMLRGRLQGFLQDKGEEFHVRPGLKSANEVLANLQSVNFCAFHRDPPLPFWVGTGKSATGWMPFRNKVVNIEMAARARWAELCGETPPPEEEYVRDNSADLFTTNALPYDYDPMATCPTFDRFLMEVQPDPETRRMLLMYTALLLVPITRYNVFAWLFGGAGCGKSTYIQVVQFLLGDFNSCALRLEEFDDKFAIWQLTERLANIVGDQNTNDPFGKIYYIMDGQFKDTVSGGVVQVQRKHQDVVTAPCIARHLFAANALPSFSASSEAIWDRLRAIPFQQRFRNTDREDKLMPEKLKAECPGIVNRLLPALGELLTLGRFPESQEAMDAKGIHRQACDPDQQWLLDNYALKQGGCTKCEEMYKEYSEYMFEHGYRRRSVAAFNQHVLRTFGRRPTQKMAGGKHVYVFEDILSRSFVDGDQSPF
ncbi:MAG: phage/plasmid primase, P4 family [Oligosphaeraceae bacterium]